MGMEVGTGLSLQNGTMIDVDHCNLIKIGNNVTMAPESVILAHDASMKNIIGGRATKVAPVEIGDRVFIGAKAIILPGVKILDNVIIGAGSVVTKDIPSGVVVAGNPAKALMSIEDYTKKSETTIGLN